MAEGRGTKSAIAKLREATEALYNAIKVGVMGATPSLNVAVTMPVYNSDGKAAK
jgi:hypothetical protein